MEKEDVCTPTWYVGRWRVLAEVVGTNPHLSANTITRRPNTTSALSRTYTHANASDDDDDSVRALSHRAPSQHAARHASVVALRLRRPRSLAAL
eukprot:7390983-Prymnesium_polylepis.1